MNRHDLCIQGMEENLNAVTERIIGAVLTVHRVLGPGLLESAYDACLAFELVDRGFTVERQKPLPLIYREVAIDCSYRLDLVVNREVVVEVKSVEKITHVHHAQMLSYLRLSGCTVGLLINFNVKWLSEEGIKRFVNGFQDR
jgi:GxxExxY protein